jgi:hypothetical protein
LAGKYCGFLAPFSSQYLFVDGQCRFWVSEDVWAGARTGSLSEQQASILEAEVHYAEFAELSGNWRTRGCSDGGTWTVSDGASQITCYCGCTDEGVPAGVSEVGQAIADVAGDLWRAGTAFDGPLRIAAEDITQSVEDGLDLDWQPWPLSSTITAALFGSEAERSDPTAGLLIDDPSECQMLRTLRTDYVLAHAMPYDEYLPVTADGSYYALLMRDVIPCDPGAS